MVRHPTPICRQLFLSALIIFRRVVLNALMADDIDFSSYDGGWKYALIASKSSSVVQRVPAGRPLLRSRSCVLHTVSGASTKCNSCSTCVRSISSRNHARCVFVSAAKSSTMEILFDKRTQNVWRERVPQSRITVHEGRNVGDLARKQGIQEIVLHEKDSIFSNGQISCESGLACRHHRAGSLTGGALNSRLEVRVKKLFHQLHMTA